MGLLRSKTNSSSTGASGGGKIPSTPSADGKSVTELVSLPEEKDRKAIMLVFKYPDAITFRTMEQMKNDTEEKEEAGEGRDDIAKNDVGKIVSDDGDLSLKQKDYGTKDKEGMNEEKNNTKISSSPARKASRSPVRKASCISIRKASSDDLQKKEQQQRLRPIEFQKEMMH
eukprot:14833234-Ditylum_brightwellii.AAC.1